MSEGSWEQNALAITQALENLRLGIAKIEIQIDRQTIALSVDAKDMHDRLRHDMDSGFSTSTAQHQSLRDDVQELKTQIAVIEALQAKDKEERENEQAKTLQKGGAISFVVSMAMNAAFEGFKKWTGAG